MLDDEVEHSITEPIVHGHENDSIEEEMDDFVVLTIVMVVMLQSVEVDEGHDIDALQ